jgi:hypothetical protein
METSVTLKNVIGAVYDSSCFMYMKNLKSFIGDYSTTPKVLRQLWKDSMDIGFGIRSIKTNRIVFFTLKNLLRNEEGEIEGWVFEVYNPTNHRDLEGLTATIYK